MIALRLIARLLDYPDRALWHQRDPLLATLTASPPPAPLNAAQARQLADFIRHYCQQDLLQAQAQYGECFDRGRATSLLMFEHIHGESRQRGQAMIDLLAQYQAAGLTLTRRELPDYLPLYLDFLASRDPDTARQGLVDIAPILALLAARLAQRQSPHALLLQLLSQLAGISAPPEAFRQQAAAEPRDDSPAALDAIWREEHIRFHQTPCCDNTQHAHQTRFRHSVPPQYPHLTPDSPIPADTPASDNPTSIPLSTSTKEPPNAACL